MNKHKSMLETIGVIIAVFCLVWLLAFAAAPIFSAQASGQVIHFNGQTLDLSGSSNVMVQSSNNVQVFDADEQGGVVTVTTSIVTVTVWMKP